MGASGRNYKPEKEEDEGFVFGLRMKTLFMDGTNDAEQHLVHRLTDDAE